MTTNNITYTWPNAPDGTADNYQANGQVLPVPAISDAAFVGFLGASTNGNTTGTATLTYTDGTTSTFTLSLTDWTLLQGAQSQPSYGNTIVAAAMPVINTNINQQTANAYLFSTQQAIPNGKTLQSVTLPTSTAGGQIHIFAVGLSGPAYNNTGRATIVAPQPPISMTRATVTRLKRSTSGDLLRRTNCGDDMAYTWPTAGSGNANNYLANGQILPVTPVANATTLGFLGSAVNGPHPALQP